MNFEYECDWKPASPLRIAAVKIFICVVVLVFVCSLNTGGSPK